MCNRLYYVCKDLVYVISRIIGIYCGYFTVYIRVAAYSLLQSFCILCLRSMCYIGCTGYYVVRFFCKCRDDISHSGGRCNQVYI